MSHRCGKVKAQGNGNSDKMTESLFSLNLPLFEKFGSSLARKKRDKLCAGSFSNTYSSWFCNEL